MKEIENGFIEDVFIGIEDHGILTVYIKLKGDSWGQSYGGYDMRELHMAISIEKLLETFEVDCINKLKDLPLRVERSETGLISKIGHFVKDRWFSFI